MLISETFSRAGFCPVVHNTQFKCAFITHSPQYADCAFSEMKQHNDSDEVFVLLEGSATLYTCEDIHQKPDSCPLAPRTAYTVTAGTWHYLAVSEDAVLFVSESASMKPENTKTAVLNR